MTITKAPSLVPPPKPSPGATNSSGPSVVNSLRAPSILLLGPPGSGKTRSLTTLIKAGLELFVLCTEPTGVDSLLDGIEQQKLDINKLHYKVIPPARVGFDALLEMSKTLSMLDHEGLSKMRPTSGRDKAQWFDMLACVRDFRCDRTGQSYGPVMDFNASRAFCVDSFSGLSDMAWDITLGNKVTAHQGEWGAAQNMLWQLTKSFCSNFKCLFVCTAHVERETDENTRASKLMVSTLGRKLAPKIPKDFSEVVAAYREGEQYFWSTMHNDMDLKHRALKLAAKLPADFAPVVEQFKKRQQAIVAAKTPGA